MFGQICVQVCEYWRPYLLAVGYNCALGMASFRSLYARVSACAARLASPFYSSVFLRPFSCHSLGNITARAPTRSPQGHRARQNAAKNPADLHAGRFARRAQARVAAEGNARGSRRASAPRASSTRSRVSGEEGPPLPRPRTAAPAAGPWPPAGRPSPERSEAERGASVAARQRRA